MSFQFWVKASTANAFGSGLNDTIVQIWHLGVFQEGSGLPNFSQTFSNMQGFNDHSLLS